MSLLECIAIPAEHDRCIDYYPVYFQACKGASPVLSGIYALALGSVAPAGIITGISIKLTGRYRPQMWIGWILTIVGFGLLSTIRATDAVGKSIGYLVLLGCGVGFVVLLCSYLRLMR